MPDSAFSPYFGSGHIQGRPPYFRQLGRDKHGRLVLHVDVKLAELQVQGLAEHVNVCLQGQQGGVGGLQSHA